MREKTAVVLGAGASCSYGFPVGSRLRQDLLKLIESPSRNAELLGVGRETLREFVRSFQAAQTYSIDAFLGRRWREFEYVGKAAIAHVLLTAESNCNLFDEDRNDHWYQYLVNELATDSWETFDPSWLSIVTFNYDRSLETYLCRALQEIYGKSEADVVDRLQSIRIVHVYGSLGSPWRGYSDFLPFGVPDVGEATAPAAKRIQVIPEGRDDGPTIGAAQEILSAASRICFLGFGFDRTNIRRLGAPVVFREQIVGKIVATAVGLTRAEMERAARQIFGERYDDNLLAHFKNMNCIQLLKDTLILDGVT
jgi:hypothetical protein